MQSHQGLSSLVRPLRCGQSGGMFTAHYQSLPIDLGVAQTRLAGLMSRDGLSHASQDAYEDGLAHVIRVGPLGDVPGLSKLVKVSFVDPVCQEGTMTLGLRWEAVGVTGGLFPVLDGNLMLTGVDDDTTQLGLVVSYRPPLGNLGARLDKAILSRVADATIRALLRNLATALVSPESPSADAGMPD